MGKRIFTEDFGISDELILKFSKMEEADIVEYCNNFDTEDEIDTFLDLVKRIKHNKWKNPLSYYEVASDRHLEIHASSCREIFIVGGNGASKTHCGLVQLCAHILGIDYTGYLSDDIKLIPNNNSLFWACGIKLQSTIESLRDNGLYKMLPKNSDGVTGHYVTTSQTLFINSGQDNLNLAKQPDRLKVPRVTFKSYESTTTGFQSANIDACLIDEQCPLSIYKEIQSRLARAKNGGYLINSITPITSTSNWLYDYIILNRDGNDSIYYTNPPLQTKDNSKLPKGAIERYQNIFGNAVDGDQRLGGELVFIKGLVHPQFSIAKHMIEPFGFKDDNIEWKFFRVVDLHPSLTGQYVSWFAFTKYPNPKLVLFDELYFQGTINQLKKEIVYRHPDKVFKFTIADSPESNNIIKVTGNSMTLTLAQPPDAVPNIPANRNLQNALDRFNDYLNNDGSFFMFNNMIQTRNQMNKYCYPSKNSLDSSHPEWDNYPNSTESHLVRNLHYAVLTMPALKNEQQENKTNIHAKHNQRNYSRYKIKK